MSNKNREAFQAYHEANPMVYAEFKRRVEQLWAKGIRHYSSDSILHIIRFHSAIDARPGDAFKVNNNFSAFYARMWQQQNPDRATFFETRVQRASQ